MDQVVFQTFNTISLIAVLFLVALGLTITWGLMNVINMAHGEFFMLGAYTALMTSQVGLPTWLSLLAAPVLVGLFGALLEETLIQRLYKRPIDTLLATWGISLVLRQAVQIIFGARQRGGAALFSGTVNIFGTAYPVYRFFVMGVAAAVAVAFVLVLYRSNFGVLLRSVIANRAMAQALGVNTRRIDRTTFAVGAGIAGLAGAVIAPMATINPQIGLSYLINAFLIVIVGGQGAGGVFAGAGFVGATNSTLLYFLSPILASVLVLVLAIIALRLRPEGLAAVRK